MKENRKKIASLMLLATVLGTTANTINVQAEEKTTPKEEVIYVNLDGEGEIEKTYAVNIFTDSNIIDYGDYSEVKNMNTNDKINFSSGKVTINNSADKLYYEGIMENVQIPWKVDISYKLDGKEYSAQEIAGKSGALKMEIKITKNDSAKEGFFDNYALQTVVQLDGEKCKNILSDGATVANVGGVKQLTYTIMPGTEKDIVISADVNDFEMESIAINGVRLNLGISSDSIDTSKLSDKITELNNAISDLDDGANKLNDGAGTLDNGTKKLNDGINEINNGLNALNEKSSSLTGGSSQVKNALNTIQSSLKNVNMSADELSKLSSASSQIKTGIDSLVSGLKTMDGSIDSYYSALNKGGITDINDFIDKNNQAISALGITDTQRNLYNAYVSGGQEGVLQSLGELVKSQDSEALALYNKYISGESDAVTNYITNAGKLISIESLLKGDVAYIQGSNALISGIDGALDNKSGNLMTGALALQTSYTQFNSSIQNLVSSLENLASSMNELKSGIDTLVENYDTLDNGIEDYTKGVNSITQGYSKILDGAINLVNGTSSLYNGTNDLVKGTGEFSNKTSNLNDEVSDEIDNMLNEFTGTDYKVVSFVSDKNTNVNSVQFVIKSEAIEKKEVNEEIEDKKENLTMWQKFLNLFKK